MQDDQLPPATPDQQDEQTARRFTQEGLNAAGLLLGLGVMGMGMHAEQFPYRDRNSGPAGHPPPESEETTLQRRGRCLAAGQAAQDAKRARRAAQAARGQGARR